MDLLESATRLSEMRSKLGQATRRLETVGIASCRAHTQEYKTIYQTHFTLQAADLQHDMLLATSQCVQTFTKVCYPRHRLCVCPCAPILVHKH